jgi:hypothetical protein
LEKHASFRLLKNYRQKILMSFLLNYQRSITSKVVSQKQMPEIRRALLAEKKIVEDPDLPISGYNYTAIQRSS